MNFQSKLSATNRSPEIPESEDVYGWLTGSWDLEVRRFRGEGPAEKTRGEAHFARVLEGRAVQDFWIMPGVYGTTLRVWDGSIAAWRVTWINPPAGTRNELIGRAVGKDLVQVGQHADGTPVRWMFRDITPDSFRWTGEALSEDGNTWRLEAEFHATRRG